MDHMKFLNSYDPYFITTLVIKNDWLWVSILVLEQPKRDDLLETLFKNPARCCIKQISKGNCY